MGKIVWKGGTLLSPVPAVLVSCGTMEKADIVTVGWTGLVSTKPPRVSVSLRPTRYSYGLIRETGEFVINLPLATMSRYVDWCGTFSGAHVDKFEQMPFTKMPASNVACPLIEECPVALECRVFAVYPMGSHDMFVADIVNVDVDENLVDESGAMHLEKVPLMAYAHGDYYALGRKLGHIGYSATKRKTNKPQK